MIERKKRLIFIQIFLFLAGILLIYLTYSSNNKIKQEKTIISKVDQELLSNKSNQEGNVFINIEYTGIDLAGNRYILKSKEATTVIDKQELVNLKGVEAVFYFKDDTILYIWSKFGLYNNKTLDMKFETDVKAVYQEAELIAEKAEYSNSNSFITISENVKVKDIQGNLLADKLYFDLKSQTLNITSYDDRNINANIILNEKRF
jgi:hypothetical protein|tara:strand:- start:304 stop:915 length:612 start_codon:yes stop_codon:yes gene_type:complete